MEGLEEDYERLVNELKAATVSALLSLLECVDDNYIPNRMLAALDISVLLDNMNHLLRTYSPDVFLSLKAQMEAGALHLQLPKHLPPNFWDVTPLEVFDEVELLLDPARREEADRQEERRHDAEEVTHSPLPLPPHPLMFPCPRNITGVTRVGALYRAHPDAHSLLVSAPPQQGVPDTIGHSPTESPQPRVPCIGHSPTGSPGQSGFPQPGVPDTFRLPERALGFRYALAQNRPASKFHPVFCLTPHRGALPGPPAARPVVAPSNPPLRPVPP